MAVIVRPARFSEIDEILEVEESAWDEGQRAHREQWESRINIFNEGTLVATVSGTIMGLLSTEVINDYDFTKDAFTWYEITDNGYIRNTHTEHGTYLYGVDLSVARGAPPDVAATLLVAAADLTIRKGLKGVLLGGRIPGFHRIVSGMSVYDYVFGKRSSGRPLDPEMYMYSKYSVQPIKVLPDYFRDPESLNYGVLMYWANPFQAETSEECRFSIKPLSDLFARTEQKLDATIGFSTCLHLELPGAGCPWAANTGGCSMCGFSEATSSYSHGQLLRPVLFESMYRVARESALLEKPGILSVFNGGSFLNAEEIPSEFQAYLAAEVSQDPDIKMLYIETRAEYVTEENLSRLKPLLLSKRLVLGIGLESITDHVRNQIIRKGLDLETYQSAINIAHEWGAAVRSYVLLKPHGLTESEAVQEAIATIRAAFAMGSDEVSLEASFVSSGTVLHKLYESGNFKTPSLYSIAQVLIDTASEGPVYLGKFTDNPPPIAAPDSCPLCSETMMELLDEFRNSLDTSVLAVLPECECRWKMR